MIEHLPLPRLVPIAPDAAEEQRVAAELYPEHVYPVPRPIVLRRVEIRPRAPHWLGALLVVAIFMAGGLAYAAVLRWWIS